MLTAFSFLACEQDYKQVYVMNLQLFKLFNFNIHLDSIYFIMNKITNRYMLKIIVMNLQLFLFKLFKFTNLSWPHKCIDVLINHLLFDVLHTYMEILFLIKVMNHKNYEFNPLVSSLKLPRLCLQYVKIKLSCGAVKLRMRYYSGSTSNTTLRSCCPDQIMQ